MIRIENFSKRYNKEVLAVANLNLEINDGDIYAFIGHNGAGKTTTIKAIVGILSFEEGDIYINNKSIKTDALMAKKEIAYIPDNPDLYDHLKGIDYINFIADIYQVPKQRRLELITKYGEMFEITNNLGDEIASYSHGMKQKIAIISALVHEPKVLILDEPFVGLDPVSTHNLKQEMKNLAAQGASIFFSTHVLDVAEKLCNKIAIIKKGELIYQGSMEEALQKGSLENFFMELEHNEIK